MDASGRLRLRDDSQHNKTMSEITLAEHQSRAGKARMKKLSKAQRRELGRKAGLASGQKRKLKNNDQTAA